MKKVAVVAFLYVFCLPLMAANYVGGEKCKSCHAEAYEHWKGSPHDQAMQPATEQTVLGDFDSATFTHFGVTTQFFRRDGKFMVRTDGADGRLQDFVVKYTFGVYPLQQYLIPFPGGRLQVLDIAWDSRSKTEGGQRWYHLHPEEKITHDDVLHWTGPNLNWNLMCADCHSTNVKKNYDIHSLTYHTRWSEIDVACEACHGPGSDHLQWAREREGSKKHTWINKGLTTELTERRNVKWRRNHQTGKPSRSRPNTSRAEIEVCVRCHSRRSQLADDFVPGQPFMDTYHPSLLLEGMYYPDGQMQDEVYMWGSFQQSKMFHEGVTCSDCHDPHAATLKLPGEQVCYQCHAQEHYASKTHHHHQPQGQGSSCIECHMPATVFMGVDRRHDHAFRIPRPDLSVKLGTPNACNQCHGDKTARWASSKLHDWNDGRTPRGFQQFAPIIQDARKGIASREQLTQLARNKVQPVIARATALGFMPGIVDQQSLEQVEWALTSKEPLIRLGVLDSFQAAPVQQRILLLPLLKDELRSIRIQAAQLLAAYPRKALDPEQLQILDRVIKEYISSQEFNGDRPEAQLNLGNLYADLGSMKKAIAAYEEAIHLQPEFVPAYVNLAQLLSTQGQDQQGQKLLNKGLSKVPRSAVLHHALGLSQIRLKQPLAALSSLQKAAELEMENSRYQYVYAVMLQSLDRLDDAIKVLQMNVKNHPSDVDSLSALWNYYRQAGNIKKAAEVAARIEQLSTHNISLKNAVDKAK